MIGGRFGRMLRVRVVTLGLGALFGVGALQAQLALLSPEIRVAEKRWHRDHSAVVASNGEGRFAIAWCRDTFFVADNYDGWWTPIRTSVWVRVFDGLGVAVASGPVSPFGRPALAATGTGLLAFWPQPGIVDLTYLQALDSEGVRQGEAVPIATEGTPVVGFVGVARVSSDRSVLVWDKYYPHPRFAYRYVEVLARTFRP